MSTQFTVLDGQGVKIELDERSCKFDLDIIIERPRLEEEGRLFVTAASHMDERQVIDIAVRLLGPLMYHYDPARIMTELEAKLRERGYY